MEKAGSLKRSKLQKYKEQWTIKLTIAPNTHTYRNSLMSSCSPRWFLTDSFWMFSTDLSPGRYFVSANTGVANIINNGCFPFICASAPGIVHARSLAWLTGPPKWKWAIINVTPDKSKCLPWKKVYLTAKSPREAVFIWLAEKAVKHKKVEGILLW